MIKLFKKLNLKIILEWGIYLTAFLLTLQTRYFLLSGEISGGYSEYTTISLYGIDILILALIVLKLISNFKFQISNEIKDSRFKIQNYWYFIAGLELFIFVSIFFAEDKILAVYRYGLFLLGLGLFWTLISANFNKIKLLYFFIAGMILQAGLGVWQFLAQSSFANKWLGLSLHDPRQLGVSVIEAVGPDGVGERWLRAYGGMDHPNMLGGALAIGLLIVLGVYLKIFNFQFSTLPNDRQVFKKFLIFNFKKFQNYLLLIFYFLFFTSLLFTFSRTAWLAFSAGTIMLLFYYAIKKNYYKQRELLIIILISLVLLSLIFSQYSNLFKTRFSLSSRLENISYVERISSIEDSKKIIKNNFYFGAGAGNYSLELENNTEDSHPSWYYQPVHNVFLLIWSELGLFGLLFFVFMLFYFFWDNIKQKKYFNLVLLCPLFIIMMLDHWLWSLHFGVLFFWFILGIIYKD